MKSGCLEYIYINEEDCVLFVLIAAFENLTVVVF